MVYTVNKLSQIVGVSVRTLHYYDEIGLLKPKIIHDNGYRIYSENELIKLQQIIFFRDLDFSLEQIKSIINSDNFDRLEALKDQKKLLEMENSRIKGLIKTIEQNIKLLEGNNYMNNDDTNNDLQQIEEYKEEARQKWGNTNAYKQSVERTKNLSRDDYERIGKRGKELTQEIADNIDKSFDSEEIQKLIQKHYESIQFFYDLSFEMYKNLGEMYITDARFTKYYDDIKPGLAEYMNKAINYFVSENI